MRKSLVTIVIVLCLSQITHAQDWISLIGGGMVNGKVESVEEERLVLISMDEDSLIIPKVLIKKVFFEDGATLFVGANKRRLKRPFGVGVNVFGPMLNHNNGLGAVYLNYYIHPQFSFELGSDLLAVYGGLKYLPLSAKKDRVLAPYFGVNIVRAENDSGNRKITGYFPLGMEAFFKNGLIASFEVALATESESTFDSVLFGFKLGYQFSRN